MSVGSSSLASHSVHLLLLVLLTKSGSLGTPIRGPVQFKRANLKLANTNLKFDKFFNTILINLKFEDRLRLFRFASIRFIR